MTPTEKLQRQIEVALANPKSRQNGLRLQQGLCYECGDEPFIPGKMRGPKCLALDAERNRLRSERKKNLPAGSHERKPSIKEEGTFNPDAESPKRQAKETTQKDRTGEYQWKSNMRIYWEGIGSAFSGTRLPLQYAHIKRHESVADHFLANGLPLTPTEHFLYDHGYIRVTADYIIEISWQLKGIPAYEQLDGKRLRLPEDNTYWPEARTFALHDKQSKWRGAEAHANQDQPVSNPTCIGDPEADGFAVYDADEQTECDCDECAFSLE